MNNPFFSIIVPVFNTGKELKRCVDSVLFQSFHDFELILVDDGSTDDSGKICDEYKRIDERVVTKHQKNAGCSEARNTGLRLASGEYLLFLDSDDLWTDHEALKEIFVIIKHNPMIDVVVFGVEIYTEDGKFVKARKVEQPQGQEKKEVIKQLVYTNQYFSTSYVKVLRKDFFIQNNLFFIKGLLSEDMEWSARIMVLCKDIKVYNSTFYRRIRRNEGSITSSIGIKNIKDILFSIENGIVFIDENIKDKDERDLYYEYWAYQYAMLLGLAAKISGDPDFDKIYDRLKKLKWLLQFDHVKKVRMMKYAVRTFGLKGAMKLLSAYYDRK